MLSHPEPSSGCDRERERAQSVKSLILLLSLRLILANTLILLIPVSFEIFGVSLRVDTIRDEPRT